MSTLSLEMQRWVALVDSQPLAADPSDGDCGGDYPASWWKVAQRVGNYSEAFFACSYNDDDVLALLVSGKMNEKAEAILAGEGLTGWFVHQMDEDFKHRGRFAEALMEACVEAGGWPVGWPNVERLGPYLKKLGYDVGGAK